MNQEEQERQQQRRKSEEQEMKSKRKEHAVLRNQIRMQLWLTKARERLARDDGASLVETLVWAGAIAVAAVAIVALIQAWGTGKVNALP